MSSLLLYSPPSVVLPAVPVGSAAGYSYPVGATRNTRWVLLGAVRLGRDSGVGSGSNPPGYVRLYTAAWELGDSQPAPTTKPRCLCGIWAVTGVGLEPTTYGLKEQA